MSDKPDRVARGGVCINRPQYARVACSSDFRLGICDGYLGIRLVEIIDDPAPVPAASPEADVTAPVGGKQSPP